MPVEFTDAAFEEIRRRASLLKGRTGIVLVYWEKAGMDVRRTSHTEAQWYITQPAGWRVDVQPLEEFPSQIKNHPALQTAGTFAVLAEGPDKKPVFGAHVLDYQNGQFEMRPQPA
jgi:hypothetical protein